MCSDEMFSFDCMILVISEFSDAGSAGGLTFPFEVFTDSLPEFSHAKKFP